MLSVDFPVTQNCFGDLKDTVVTHDELFTILFRNVIFIETDFTGF